MKIFIMYFTFMISSCSFSQKERNNVSSNVQIAKDTNEVIKVKRIVKDTTKTKKEIFISSPISLPYGKDSLLSVSFPKEWKIDFSPTKGYSYGDKNSQNYVDIFLSSGNILLQTTFSSSYDSISKIYKEKDGTVHYYDTALLHTFKSVLSHNYFDELFLLKETDEYKTIMVYLPYATPKEMDYYGSGDSYGYRRGDIISIDKKSNELIDHLNIYNTLSWVYSTQDKLFYIDKDTIIHCKTFRNNEETIRYLRYEKWQIKSNGKFVRYYEKEGYFKNEEEQGTVKNSMREGKWIEKKPNGWVEKKTYLESYFEAGEPIGEWEFYDYTNNKKGKLLYTESYENGELVKRKFVEK